MFNNLLRAVAALLALEAAVASPARARDLTFEERVAAQRAIEEVYWRHRIWPKENPTPKPPLGEMMSEIAIRTKVENYLKKSAEYEKYWGRPITAKQLQAEMDRMGESTRAPDLLRELFAALGSDPFLMAETLARQTLADRLLRNGHANESDTETASVDPSFSFPRIIGNGCTPDTWREIDGSFPSARGLYTAVWTGSEMIVWGGYFGSSFLNTGGRYDPATDSWLPTSTAANVPSGRYLHTAVWTGSEMIVWGGADYNDWLNTGGRYDPATDSWLPTSTQANVPSGRFIHTAVWTGAEMIVWGGNGYPSRDLNTGGRYNPTTDSWVPTSTGFGVPSVRLFHTAVWTGSEMIVWGGSYGSLGVAMEVNTGGRYDPVTDTWIPTSTGPYVPSPRYVHTAVWTGAEMIVWGGFHFDEYLNTGGRYDPVTDTWIPTSTGGPGYAPRHRASHAAVWTGVEMIVLGGDTDYPFVGDAYHPGTNSWRSTAWPTNPFGGYSYPAVWTGSQVIVWDGYGGGGRYCPCREYFLDQDLDGFGDPAISAIICSSSIPSYYVSDNTDCDDYVDSIHPGAFEACNGIDDDCNGVVDDGGGPMCDDGNPCTDDTCGREDGCFHTNTTAPCDDGNACTTSDTCGDGRCLSGPSTDVDHDGVCVPPDNCPTVANPEQLDMDQDGQGDVCDPCPADPLNDFDGDGLCCDGSDACCLSDLNPTITVEGCDSGVPNTLFPDGCTIGDNVAACRVGASNHGQFVSCVSHLTDALKAQGVITGRQRSRIQRCAVHSNPNPASLGIRTVTESGP